MLGALSAALSALSTGANIYKSISSVFGKNSKSSRPNTISYNDALTQAQQAINPQYETNLQRALAALNTNSAAQGVSGQDRTKNQMATQISNSEANRSSAAASLAQQIMSGQNAQNLDAYIARNKQNQQAYENQQSGLQSLLDLLNKNGTQTPSWEKGKYSYRKVQ